jgi:signal transduction histidine kinase
MLKLKTSSGIVSLFRLFMLLRLIFPIFMLLSLISHPPGLVDITGPLIAGMAECLLLVGYLSWPWLEKRLGRFYLPLGLLTATLAPWLENQLILNGFQRGIELGLRTLPGSPPVPSPVSLAVLSGILFLTMQMQLLFMLFIPMILISWRYSFKWVLITNLGLIALDIVSFVIVFQPSQSFNLAPLGIVLVRTALFLMTGFVINRLAFEEKERNRQLSHYASTLEQLSTSRERNRLAREIHDTLAHTLSGLAVNLEAVEALWDGTPDQAKDILKQSLTVTRSGLVETRRAIQALRAGPLEDLGLILALKQLALSSAERYDLQADLDLPPKVEELDPAVEQCIYRVAEEGFRNLCQHAHASQFRMTLCAKDGRIEFTLSDNGQGFENRPEVQDGHYGLKGMQERTEAAGGELSIHSQPGQGTTLRLVV